ncbi:aldo/keto reductase [Rossellomorea vietnamensis]|uniref:aldo/keto reductase n=1 Tax=Rossellomorea vietnamensis TaxID=218284 RepID=UPI0009EEBBCE|nr:aldo/keto reductase [Rossellomorea vietnamensis]
MEYITLKNSDLRVSRLCMGGCPMGGHGWGDVSENNLVNAVHTAIDKGVNFFDTADTYGLGKSEEVLGRAIKDNRDKVVVATKFGVRVESGKTFYDNSPDWIEKAVKGSLKRLGTDYIDLYQIHYRDNKTNINDVIYKLEDLKNKGYIRYYGLSNIHQEDKTELNSHIGKFVSFQDEYSLACRKNEGDLLNLSNELELTPLTWGSLGQGILTGKYDSNVKFDSDDRRSRDIYINFHGEKLKKNLEIVSVMRKISEQTGKSIPSIALRFILDHIPNSAVLAGIKNPNQLLSNLEAMEWNLSSEQINELLLISEDKEVAK